MVKLSLPEIFYNLNSMLSQNGLIQTELHQIFECLHISARLTIKNLQTLHRALPIIDVSQIIFADHLGRSVRQRAR